VAVRRKPRPVAALAEGGRDGGDQAHFAAPIAVAPVLGYAVGMAGIHPLQGPVFGQTAGHLLGRHHAVHAPVLTRTHIHVFDEAQEVAVGPREGRQRQDLVLVHAPLQYAVEFEGPEPRGPCGGDALQHTAHRQAAVRKGGEAIGIQGIQAHRHPVQARHTKGPGKLRQQRAVGGEGNVPQLRDRPQAAHQLRQVPPQQRLSAREAHLPHPQRHEQAHQPLDLLEAQDGLAIQEGVVVAEPLPGHAVGTAEVAAVRNRNPEGAEGAVQTVHGFHT